MLDLNLKKKTYQEIIKEVTAIELFLLFCRSSMLKNVVVQEKKYREKFIKKRMF